MLAYNLEPFHKVEPDLYGLVAGHWAETGEEGRDLRVSMPFYRDLDAKGMLLMTTAREPDEFLAGYGAVVMTFDPHESLPFATTDAYYLHPSYRKGRNAIRLLEAMESSAKTRGARYLYIGVHPRNDYSRLLQHLGYREVETYYRRDI